jgi:hypothetical protein
VRTSSRTRANALRRRGSCLSVVRARARRARPQRSGGRVNDPVAGTRPCQRRRLTPVSSGGHHAQPPHAANVSCPTGRQAYRNSLPSATEPVSRGCAAGPDAARRHGTPSLLTTAPPERRLPGHDACPIPLRTTVTARDVIGRAWCASGLGRGFGARLFITGAVRQAARTRPRTSPSSTSPARPRSTTSSPSASQRSPPYSSARDP